MKKFAILALVVLLIAAFIFAQKKDLTIVRVWVGPEVDYEGEPSPDGKYLSFVDWETGDLAIRDLATGEMRRITSKGTWFESTEFALNSMWSLDNTQVVYNWFNKDLFFDLRISEFDSSKERILYQNKEIEWVEPHDWSPDGKQILAIFSPEEEKNQIVLVSVEDGSVQVIKNLNRDYPWGKMRFSPDGNYIVFDLPEKEDAPDHDIYLLSADGKSEIPLVEYPGNDVSLGWSPCGNWILFSSDRKGTRDVWAIRVAEGKPQGDPELIKTEMGQIWPMGFTKKGTFYYGLSPSMADAYIASIDLEKGKLITPPRKVSRRFIGSNNSPEWSPDGKHIAYVSKRIPGPARRIGSNVLCIRSIETGEERELSPKLTSFGQLRWSPDGRTILVGGRTEKDRRGLFMIDTQSGDITLVLERKPEINIIPWSWSPDGKTIFYTQIDMKKKTSQIMVYDLVVKKEKEIYSKSIKIAPINNLALSPDGEMLAFVAFELETQSSILKIIPAGGGETHDLLQLKAPEAFRSIAWTADGREILFSKFLSYKLEEQRCQLWRIPAKGGEAYKAGLEMDQLGSLRVHPDGKRIAFTSGSSKGEVWMMENFLPEEKSPKS